MSPDWIPRAAHDAFGVGEKYRACRVVIQDGTAHRMACWVTLGKDGSVSVGLSDPGFVVTEVGTARIAEDGTLVRQPSPADALPAVTARTAPHITLHSSGVCHAVAHGHRSIVQTMHHYWFPPIESFEWMHLTTSPIDHLPAVAPKSRDALVPSPGGSRSLKIRFDVLPRQSSGAYPAFSEALHTLLGLSPQYALRVSVFPCPATGPAYIIRVHKRGAVRACLRRAGHWLTTRWSRRSEAVVL